MKKPFAAIALCAGKGTRMKSARAKVLHEVLGRPLCFYPLSRALALGASPAVAVVGHQAEEVEATLRSHLPQAPLRFARQAEQLGTAHAVLCAKPALRGFAGDVLIVYGDVPLVTKSTLEALFSAKRSARAPLALVTAQVPNPHGYGRIVREGGSAVRIVEEKDCTPEERAIAEVNAGLYLVDSDFLWKSLRRVGAKNAQREFYLTDMVSQAAAAGLKVAAVQAPFEEVAGVNDRVELARAAGALRRRINEAHMRAGVTFDAPETAWVDERVSIGADARIGPNCTLTGATAIGPGASLGIGCSVHASEVGEGAQIKAYSVLEEAKVGRAALVGPFARLRPGTELAEGVHVGNFVETKKARIGKGSKANHLTYLGDCDIGAGVNVGAGTITCNYDGVNKHKTVLGDRVFVGSDSQFVAPVTVGENAYIGAGSTITDDVPPYSLAIARGRQVVKEGYVKRRLKA